MAFSVLGIILYLGIEFSYISSPIIIIPPGRECLFRHINYIRVSYNMCIRLGITGNLLICSIIMTNSIQEHLWFRFIRSMFQSLTWCFCSFFYRFPTFVSFKFFDLNLILIPGSFYPFFEKFHFQNGLIWSWVLTFCLSTLWGSRQKLYWRNVAWRESNKHVKTGGELFETIEWN